MPKRILIFSLAYYPSFVSGAEAAIKEITDRIDPEDIEFHLITHLFDKSEPRQERIGNVTVYRVGFGGAYLSKILYVPLSALLARRLHSRLRFNGLWSMMTYMLFPLVLARLIGVRVSYLLTLQDGDPYEKVFERWFIRPFTPLLDHGFRQARVIQVISHYLGEWPKKRGYRGEVIQIGNGANPDNLTMPYSDAELTAVRNELGKQPDDVYLFIAARIVHQKAMDVIVRALALLPKNVHFLIAGQGPDEPALRTLATELGVAERVRFLGALDRKEVPKYRNPIVSDIVVHPSRSEGLGNSVLSSMAARLPVVATQVGGFADYIFDATRDPDVASTAWAVDPDDPQQIADAVTDILAHPEVVARVTETARRMVEAEYTWEGVAEKMRAHVFSKLLTASE